MTGTLTTQPQHTERRTSRRTVARVLALLAAPAAAIVITVVLLMNSSPSRSDTGPAHQPHIGSGAANHVHLPVGDCGAARTVHVC